MLRQFNGPHGQVLIFNGDRFHENNQKVYYSPDGNTPQSQLYALTYDTAHSQVYATGRLGQQIVSARLDVFNPFDHSDGTIELNNRGPKGIISYRNEEYIEADACQFDLTEVKIIGLGDNRQVSLLWRTEDGSYVALAPQGDDECFYVDGREECPSSSYALNCDQDEHEPGRYDMCHEFGPLRDLIISCAGDSYGGVPLEPVDPSDYDISFREGGFFIDIARRA